jgi:hypothetical protein
VDLQLSRVVGHLLLQRANLGSQGRVGIVFLDSIRLRQPNNRLPAVASDGVERARYCIEQAISRGVQLIAPKGAGRSNIREHAHRGVPGRRGTLRASLNLGSSLVPRDGGRLPTSYGTHCCQCDERR